jgi:thiol:disulfide interchange protein DsbD
MRTRWTLFVSATLCSVALSHAGGAGQPSDEPARPALIAEFDGLVPGREITIAIAFELDPGWHTYWPGQNDTGFAPEIELALPEGFEAVGPIWPAPRRYISPGQILDHVHEKDQATILYTVRVPEDARPGTRARFAASVEWLVCREACIAGSGAVGLTLPVLEMDTTPKPGPGAARIASARARVPKPLPEDSEDLGLSWEDGALVIRAKIPVKAISFSPDENGRRILELLRAGESPTDTLRLRPGSGRAPVSGVVAMEFAGGEPPRWYRIEARSPGE